MRRRSDQREWLDDISARQRNLVFPDTATNEARFWRNILEGKQPLRLVHKVGIGLFSFAALALVLIFTLNWGDPFGHSWLQRLVIGSVNWLIGLGILFLFLLAFHLSQWLSKKR